VKAPDDGEDGWEDYGLMSCVADVEESVVLEEDEDEDLSREHDGLAV
jgi:hypothetical protein